MNPAGARLSLLVFCVLAVKLGLSVVENCSTTRLQALAERLAFLRARCSTACQMAQSSDGAYVTGASIPSLQPLRQPLRIPARQLRDQALSHPHDPHTRRLRPQRRLLLQPQVFQRLACRR